MSNVSGNWDIFVVNTAGGVGVLTDDPAADGLPAWAPDGASIAFVSNRDGAWSLYLMDTNGQNPRKVIDLGPNLPDWTSQRLSWAP
jgi:Tol biopolymer transport system component